MTNLSIFNQLRPFSVGFDDMFDHFDSMVSMAPSNYPPYNIVKTDNNNYNVEIALAGFSKKDITVEVENGILTIESVKDKSDKEEDTLGVLHKGISKRYFKKQFTIAKDVKVNGAELKDGLLKVSMERIVPEAMKLKKITVK
jgi:molecular chaperone IbpA